MNITLIFLWTLAAFIAMSIWESSIEGRNPWAKRKIGWVIKITDKITVPKYHFFLFWVMWPLLLALPFVVYGWNFKLFGILVSAYFTGIVIEDFIWFVVNPVVKLKEFWTSFTDFYPWLRINGKKIIPVYYIFDLAVAFLSWYFVWR